MSLRAIDCQANTAGGLGRGRLATWISLVLLAILMWIVGIEYGWRRGTLVILGGLLGVTLYYSSFGFTAAWRLFVFERRGAGVRAQLLMLALAVILFFPLLAAGQVFDQPLRGHVAPVGVSVVVGAFLFGVGMQLGGGCGSGTLFSVGGGQARTLLTLLSFITGATVVTFHLPWWTTLPNLGPISLIDQIGWLGGLTISLCLFATLYFLVGRFSTREPDSLAGGETPRHLIRGPWPLLWGAIALAVLNAAILVLSGRPWGITGAFSLWGGHALHAAGIPLESYVYWAEHDFGQSLLSHVPTTTNLGIILGAAAATGLMGKFSPTLRLSSRGAVTAVLGGLMMGYGARLAFGCNIGALFGGISSGSLHGWLWLVCGFAGSILGVHVRKWIGDGPYGGRKRDGGSLRSECVSKGDVPTAIKHGPKSLSNATDSSTRCDLRGVLASDRDRQPPKDR